MQAMILTCPAQRSQVSQICIYLVMGWVCTLMYSSLLVLVPLWGLIWLTSGGFAYTIGIVFYVLDDMKKLRHAHGIWHLFVLTGSCSHFISIAIYVR
jgi:hemolysin III